MRNFVVEGAGHRHGERGICVGSTRKAVLDSIYRWAKDFEEPPVYWLNGLAGTGKTTIARTIVNRLFTEGCLGASFFCSSESKDRTEFENVFPTLASQLSRKYNELDSILPLQIGEIAYECQGGSWGTPWLVQYLGPPFSTVIVIDALDECGQCGGSGILSVVKEIVAGNRNVKFFITSRPGQDIQKELDSWEKTVVTTVSLHEIEFSKVNEDIRQFFQHHLLKLRRGQGGLDDWPTAGDVDRLCERANGEFVCAMAMVKFMDRMSQYPEERLEILLKSPEIRVFKQEIKLPKKTTICALYTSILQEMYNHYHDCKEELCSILHAVVSARGSISLSEMSKDLGFPVPFVDNLVRTFAWVGNNGHIELPKSWLTFLTDLGRRTNNRFYFPPPTP